ncbi:MAG TPA: iron dependent repressor, metal binding and dimerization domain protein [Stackebrandtia sp.]|jgi:DtxR family Mn-dependent transcriptional regulator|uniref:metal-dependent transcriptional regulator n=1 Tax=Stackebrandtia sp. TaxID=2023065 RepID=UPI002D3BAAE8|nr:iron dependent repressor, metal binding and dimerization domain protein [Stackebrandtia sp.]HZE41832.1 iron dependent repressor, metal binding and dimerization domain protein [Stackebrandtia sp.]
MTTDLVDTTEMYLRTILELEEEGVAPLRARIAERLQQSGPTVSQTVARMQRDGLLHVLGDRHLDLTDLGRERAVAVMRKHRLAELLLVDVIGMSYEDAHDEACRWEHVMSDTVEHKVYALLDKPTHSPYGNPIPGLDALGGQTVSTFAPEERHLAATEIDAGRFKVTRLCESVQNDPEVLHELHVAGVNPGAVIDVARGDDSVELTHNGSATTLSIQNASRVFVVPAA